MSQTILIVDDDLGIIDLVAQYLTESNFRVVTASDEPWRSHNNIQEAGTINALASFLSQKVH